MSVRLHELYKKEVVPKLSTEFGYKNAQQVPRVTKIVVNMGIGGQQYGSRQIQPGITNGQIAAPHANQPQSVFFLRQAWVR